MLSATTNVTNQKNGLRGHLDHQESHTTRKSLPFQSVTEWAHHIISNGSINYGIIAVVHANSVKVGINPQKISEKSKYQHVLSVFKKRASLHTR